jgi:S1-C subfamily serine protease
LKNISEGVYVDKVNENSAAKDAGVKEGDVIIGLDGKRIKSSPELLEEIARRRPGDKVKLEILRNGVNKNIEVFLKNKDGNEKAVIKQSGELMKTLGAELENLNTAELKELKLKGGVKVSRIIGGKLLRSGMSEGFIITHVNDDPVKSVDDFLQKMEKMKGRVMLSGRYPDDEGEYSYGFMM